MNVSCNKIAQDSVCWVWENCSAILRIFAEVSSNYCKAPIDFSVRRWAARHGSIQQKDQALKTIRNGKVSYAASNRKISS